jgi:acyl carrier protein
MEIIAELEWPKRDKIRAEDHLVNDLNVPFLALLMVTSIEEAFGIDIPGEDADRLDTVGQWVEYLEKRIGPKR